MNMLHTALFTSRSFKSSVGLRPKNFRTIEQTLFMWGTTAGDKKKILWPLPASSFRILGSFRISGCNRFPSFTWFRKLTRFLTCVCCGRFPAALSINPPRNASYSLPWELHAPSGLKFLLTLASSFPDALSITGLSGAIGSFAEEELAETVEDKFVTVGFDFATILSSSFCSCILFAIVLEQLIKLEFWTQQIEQKRLMLKNWRRLFQLSRVKLPLVKMSASRCLVSMYLIWISESKSIISNNQSKATLWDLDTCLIVGLRPLIIIFITASLSSKMYNISLEPEGFTFDGTWSTLVKSRLMCLEFGYAYRVLCFATGFPVTLQDLSFCELGLVRNAILQSLSPKDREREYRPCVNLRQEK